MSIKVKCPGCTKTLTVPDAARGKAVKCPSCETKVPVPGGDDDAVGSSTKLKKPKKSAAPIEDEAGFSSLDLRKVADKEANVCPKCGYDLDQAGGEDEEITECPQCGWDIAEGGLGEKARKKALKGPDPDKFYQGLWKNSWNFVGINLMLVIRTFLYLQLASTISLVATLGYLYFSMLPPRYMLFAPLAFVAAMVVPGWLWYLDTEIIKLTLERKDRFKRLNFDFFLAGALGVKFVAWNIVFAGPLLAIPAAIGFSLWYFVNLPIWVPCLILAVCYIPIIGLYPVALTHMTMPIQSSGWMFWKVIPQALRCFKALFSWFMLFSLTHFPILLIMGLAALFTAGPIIEFAEILETTATTSRYQTRWDGLQGAKKKPDDLVDPKTVTNLGQIKEFTLGTWKKQAGDEVHLYEPLYDYTDKDGKSKTYHSQVRGKLDSIVVQNGGKVAANAPVAEVTPTKLDISHYIALGSMEFAWIISCVILSVVSLFNMRTNGYFAYYFREQLDLQVLLKEYKYVASLPRDNEKKIKTTGDVAAEAAMGAIVLILIGVIIGGVVGAFNDKIGIVGGLVSGVDWGASLACGSAGIGLLIAAFNVSPVWGLCIFFSICMCGVPHILFLIQEWEDAKQWFFQWLIGFLILVLILPVELLMGIGYLSPFLKGDGGQNQQAPQQPGDPAAMPGGPAGVAPAGQAPGAAPGGPAIIQSPAPQGAAGTPAPGTAPATPP